MNLKMLLVKTLAPVGLGLFCLLAVAETPSTPPAQDTFHGITRPSDRRQPSTKIQDVVFKVFVKPGDVVKEGQELFRLDDRLEQATLKILEMEAASNVSIKAAEAVRDTKLVELGRIEKMYAGQAATEQELEKAKLEAVLSALEIDRARQDQEKLKLQAEQQKVLLDKMRMISPISGIVEDVSAREAELLDPSKPAVTIVKNDPMWVEVHLPKERSIGLKIGQKLQVSADWLTGLRDAEVIYRAPVADAATDTQMVRLELPNPEGEMSGLQVRVKVPQAARKSVTAARAQ